MIRGIRVGIKYIIPESLIKKQTNLFYKVLLQTTNLIFWILLLGALIFILIFINKLTTYGVEIAVSSTIREMNVFLEPLYSPLNWSNESSAIVPNLFINILVFYALYSFAFSILAKNKVVGYVVLILISVVVIFWYYIYILSGAFI